MDFFSQKHAQKSIFACAPAIFVLFVLVLANNFINREYFASDYIVLFSVEHECIVLENGIHMYILLDQYHDSTALGNSAGICS